MTIKTIPLKDILVQNRLRHVDELEAAEIAASIKDEGLNYPIIVRSRDKGTYSVVDGAHRHRAYELLGLAEIKCDVRKLSQSEAERVEIDSNLVRAELTKAARIRFIGKSDELFARKHPDRQQGGDRRSDDFKVQSLHFENPTEHLQARLDLSRRAIYNARELYRKLHSDALSLLSEGPLADNEVQIRAVSDLAPDQQIECARRIRDGEFGTVKDWCLAVGVLEEKSTSNAPVDRWFVKQATGWGEAKKAWRRKFVREFASDLRPLLAEIDAEEAS